MSEPEPRRSVRATKGQHSKALDDEITAPPKPRAQSKKPSKKSQKKEPEPQEEEEEEEEEENIRCVCGAVSDADEEPGEAWIGCDQCEAWQHNVCMGVSSFEDEIPENYWCEQCRPNDHKALLEGMAKGEKPWEERRRVHEEKERKRKKKGGRKSKGGDRKSGSHDVVESLNDKDRKPTPAKPTPTPEPTKEKKEPAKGKRKTRDESQDTETKSSKLRRVSTEPAVAAQAPPAQPAQPVEPAPPAQPEQPQQPPTPAPEPKPDEPIQPTQPEPAKLLPKPQYTPPKDIEDGIKDLPPTRNGPAKALKKSLVHVMTSLNKSKQLQVAEGQTVDSMAETLALQIERAVFDTHPMAKGQKEYSQQIKSLSFNLKNNPELVRGLIEGVHTPPTLAVMSSEEMASSELQKQTAEMRARAEKASILLQDEQTGPRVRRTHKGDEVVGDESMVSKTEDQPPPLPPGGSGRQSASATKGQAKPKKDGAAPEQADVSMRSPSQDEGHHRSPSQSNFDINKVFSNVRSPSTSKPRPRKPSMQVQTSAQVEDADVDRLLQDENDSPPYSPTEDTQDPDVVWRGTFQMSTIADFRAKAKHIGGANFNIIGPWSELMPENLPVAGRIMQQSATEYLCSLRYSNVTDVIAVNIEPQREEDRPELNAVIEYFISKSRYGVVGLKAAGNVRDTYLVPVPAGEDNHPEFMLNLVDNYIPKVRELPMLLCVFVYRHDPSKINTSGSPITPSQMQGSPTTGVGAPAGFAQRTNSMAGPGFSPATPAAHGPLQSTTPVPIPQVPHGRGPTHPQQAQQPAQFAPPQHPQQSPPQQAGPPGPPGAAVNMSDAEKHRLNEEGRQMAQRILGADFTASTVQFLLPQAYQMTPREWEVIRDIYGREPKAKDDLAYLGQLLQAQSRQTNEEQQKQKAAGAGAGGV